MIQVFQYPHETLMQVSSEWKHEDTIQGYDDIEKFENDDETGFVFKQLYTIIEKLENYYAEEKKETE